MIEERPRLPYKPTWSNELHGYAHNAVRRYWPTLAPWYEWEDLMQEAQLTYVLCARRYTGVVDNPAWFMALFKTAWQNKIFSLLGKIPRYSLNAEAELSGFDFASPDVLQELLQVLESLPFGLRAALKDLCRLEGRLKVSRRTVRMLRTAIASHVRST